MAVVTRARATEWRVTQSRDECGLDVASALGLHSITGRLLARRGVVTAADALDFLSPRLDALHDPFLLPEARAAAERISAAIDAGEGIFVHGDYDVDGVTSAALFARVLGKLGATVVPFVPSRFRDGYGVRVTTIDAAHAHGASLVLTCDCGVSAHDACQRASELGMDVVVTDHHECPEELPSAFAVVNPSRQDSRYPFAHLAGVGVAYKVCEAVCVLRGVDVSHLHEHFLDLVALGTVSDVAPLTGENRTLVYHGLKAISRTRKQGLLALIQVSGIPASALNTEHIGFQLGPRINAAGRIAEASEALELFLTSDAGRAAEIARAMSAANSERQAEQARILEEALAAVEHEGLAEDRVIVVGGAGWHPGVVGIVAGKLTDLFYRPALVLHADDGMYRGSARSIEGFSLARALDELRPLVSGGGHAMAAGLSFPAESLTDVRKRLNDLAQEWLEEEDLVPRIDVEMEVDASDVSTGLAREIESLAPFGEGNPEPVFVTRGIALTEVKRMGGDQRHLRASVAGTKGQVQVVGFGMGEAADWLDSTRKYGICYNLRMDRYNGGERLQLMLLDAPCEEC